MSSDQPASSNGSRCHRRRAPIRGPRVDNVRAAIEVVATYSRAPRQDETVLVLLGSDYRPFGVISVNGTTHPEAVIEVVERFVAEHVHSGRASALVVASLYAADEYADPVRMIDRWFEISDIAEDAGIELLEWFVITSTIVCPRDLVGELPRWPAPD